MQSAKVRSLDTRDWEGLTYLVGRFQDHVAHFDRSREVLPFASDEERDRYASQLLADVEHMNGIAVVAESGNGELVGFATGVIIRRPSNADLLFATTHQPATQGWVGVLFVEQSQRGKGFGRALLESVKSHFIANSCTSIRLLVSTSNTSAIKLYQRAGLSEREVEMSMPLGEAEASTPHHGVNHCR